MLEKLINISREASKRILEIYHTGDPGLRLKGDGSPLTKADSASHEFISEALGDFGLPLLSEENVISFEQRRNWTRFWLLDPLDGTKEFLSRNGEFTVNLALIEGGVPVLGLIAVPVTDTIYFAEAGKGAYRAAGSDVQKIGRVIDRCRLVAAVSRSHACKQTMKYCHDNGVSEVLEAGSSLKFGLMAEGKADIYPRFTPSYEWDTAAGQAILREVDCSLFGLPDGEELRYNKENLLNPGFIARQKDAHRDKIAC